MSRAKIFENYPEKLNSCSVKELEEWVNYWNSKLNYLRGPAHKGALKEKYLVEKILAKKQNEIIHEKQIK